MLKTLTKFRIAKHRLLLKLIFLPLSLCIVNSSFAAEDFPWEIFYPAFIKKSIDKDKGGTIQINTDPKDPEVSVLTGNAYSDRLLLYGTKNTNGDVTQIQTMQYYMPGESKPMNIEVDESGRPIRITSPEGNIYTFTYLDGKMTVNCRDNAGNQYSEDFSLKDADLPLVDNSLFRATNTETVYRASSEDSNVKVENVEGTLNTHIVNPDNNADLGNVDVNEVYIFATNHEGIVAYNHIGKGQYRFTVSHRTADLNVLTAQCETRYSDISFNISSAAVVTTVIAILYTARYGKNYALPAQLLSGGGLVFSLIANYKSSRAWSCRDLVRKASVDMNIGKQRVDVNTLYLGKRLHQEIKYDLFDLNNPINIARAFNLTFTYPVQPGPVSISTIPANPKVGQSYELNVVARLPHGGSIEWEWARPDEGNSDSGQWTNNGDVIEVNQRFGPFTGAEKKTTDIVTVELYGTENNQRVKYGTIFKAISISGEKSTRICPEGKWNVKEIETNDSGQCDPRYFSMGVWEIKSDGHWVSYLGDETDNNSIWTLNGDQIVLEGKPDEVCYRKYATGTIINIGGGCNRIEGKIIKKCNYQGPFTLTDCFEADLVPNE